MLLSSPNPIIKIHTPDPRCLVKTKSPSVILRYIDCGTEGIRVYDHPYKECRNQYVTYTSLQLNLLRSQFPTVSVLSAIYKMPKAADTGQAPGVTKLYPRDTI
jgi:hypothetical protein